MSAWKKPWHRNEALVACESHPIDALTVEEADLGGCPEEGQPFEFERVIWCPKCEREVAQGTTGCLRFLLLRLQGADKQAEALKARIGKVGQKLRGGQ